MKLAMRTTVGCDNLSSTEREFVYLLYHLQNYLCIYADIPKTSLIGLIYYRYEAQNNVEEKSRVN